MARSDNDSAVQPVCERLNAITGHDGWYLDDKQSGMYVSGPLSEGWRTAIENHAAEYQVQCKRFDIPRDRKRRIPASHHLLLTIEDAEKYVANAGPDPSLWLRAEDVPVIESSEPRKHPCRRILCNTLRDASGGLPFESHGASLLSRIVPASEREARLAVLRDIGLHPEVMPQRPGLRGNRLAVPVGEAVQLHEKIQQNRGCGAER